MAHCDTPCMNNDFLEIWKFTSVVRAKVSVFKRRRVPREFLHAAKSPCINIECHISVPGRSVMSDGKYRFLTSFSVYTFSFNMLEVASQPGCGNSDWKMFAIYRKSSMYQLVHSFHNQSLLFALSSNLLVLCNAALNWDIDLTLHLRYILILSERTVTTRSKPHPENTFCIRRILSKLWRWTHAVPRTPRSCSLLLIALTLSMGTIIRSWHFSSQTLFTIG